VGVVQAVRGGRLDTALSVVTVTLFALPGYWLGLMLVMLFTYRARMLPAFGAAGFDADFLTGGARLADRLRQRVAEPVSVGGEALSVTVSVGMARGHKPAGELLRDAGSALERAKALGRDRVELFERGQHEKVLERMRLETDLRDALDRDELRLHYQPVVDLRTGATVGCEALCRWWHPTRGSVNPGEFILLAEETGLIRQLGSWSLLEAARQLAAWSADPVLGRLDVAVNLSARQLADKALPELVHDAIVLTGGDFRRLTLEVTETAVMTEPEAALGTLLRLKELGVTIAIDDFGTGYSSLVYLKRLPVDILKIDRTFVAGLPDDPEDRAIVKTIVDLAGSVGVKTVAEGIETDAQRRVCLDLGCDLGQGDLWSPAVPPAHHSAERLEHRG
jgi:EAL domain-containing protein (putative c-di-GMP-specific phosphodiesterase class I)